jgi:AraC-like DNA-binding protein
MAFKDKARQRAYLNAWRQRNIQRGLTAVGGQRYIRNYTHLTGHTIREWQEQVNQHKIKWRDLPEIIKPRVRDTQRPKITKPSRWRDKTGETLQQMATRLGLSKEAVRRRLNQYGTAEPQHLRSYRKKVA